MGDFFIDFRSRELRQAGARMAASTLRLCEDARVKIVERDAFTLVLATVDDPGLWESYATRNGEHELLVALTGRVALEPSQWDMARQIDGEGGRACKALSALYRESGLGFVANLSGNFVCLIHDEQAGKVYLVSDRYGMTLAFGAVAAAQPVFSSHPDALASALGTEQELDRVSLAEFLITGRLSFPNTYYRGVRGLDPGCIHAVSLNGGAPTVEAARPYCELQHRVDETATETELAAALADAFKRSVRLRSLPCLGRIGVGLSGGLDSRAILCSVEDPGRVFAFSLYDEENDELRTARAIAEARGVPLTGIRRSFEYYGENAPAGARIGGGTGCLASNHFLGIRHVLKEHGVQNLLTGCYCDYLFKGLAFNTREETILRRSRMSRFGFQYYRPCYWNSIDPAMARQVRSRLQGFFPEASAERLDAAAWLTVERKRTFPLAYEADSAQRTIPQRVIPWFVPIADPVVYEVYRRIPPRFKLDGSVFRKMVLILCGEEVSGIADSNTGAGVTPGAWSYAWHRYRAALRNRLALKVRPSMATRGSWPNWDYYLTHSRLLPEQWHVFTPASRETLSSLVGKDVATTPQDEFLRGGIEFFLRLWTLKLWLERSAETPAN
jgi:asparagine synthetase B (glutamine-hydrolysing)